MKILFFANPGEFRKWFEENNEKETEVLVGFHKVGSGNPSITWSESVDVAICFGWIDGIRHSIDKDTYRIRFTPRKPKSIWSAINIKKVEELTKLGLMTPAGIEAYSKREDAKSKIYAFEQPEIRFSEEMESLFKANEKAWAFFQSLAASYKKVAVWWVISAKQEQTQIKRLEQLIQSSEDGKRLR